MRLIRNRLPMPRRMATGSLYVIAEVEFDDEGIWGYENQEFDDLYPIPERQSTSPTEDLSMR